MPRNRQTVPRAERIEAIVVAARELFLANGYDGTTVAAVARRADMTSNAVHWYFPSKDDLYAAALTDLVDSMRAEVDARMPMTPRDRLTAILETIEPYRPAHLDVLSRIDESPAVKALYDHVYDWVGPAFLAAARPSFDEATEPEMIIDLVHVVLDGNAAADRRGRPFAAIVEFLLDRTIGLSRDSVVRPQ